MDSQEAELIRAAGGKPSPPLRVPIVGTKGAVNLYVSRIFVDMCYVWHDTPSDVRGFVNSLKESLARVLDVFPVLAGRMVHSGEFIDCNDAGAYLKVVNKAGKSTNMPQVPAYGEYCLIPDQRKVIAGDEPVLTVLVTVFEGGGLCLGVGFSHAVMDGASYLMFIKAWNRIHNGEPLDFQPNFFNTSKNLSVIDKPRMRELMKETGLDALPSFFHKMIAWGVKRLAAPSKANIADCESVAVTFSADQINAIKTAVVRRMKEIGDKDCWVSRGEALYGYYTHELLRIFNVPARHRKKQGLRSIVSIRGLVDGCSKNDFGNFIVSLDVDGLDLSGCWEDTAIQMHHRLRGLIADGDGLAKKYQMQQFTGRNDYFVRNPRQPLDATPGFISSWNCEINVPFYDVTFGLGKHPDKFLPWRCAGGGEFARVVSHPNGDVQINIISSRGVGIDDWVAACSWEPTACLILFITGIVMLFVSLFSFEEQEVPAIVSGVVAVLSLIGMKIAVRPDKFHKAIRAMPGRLTELQNDQV